jgi:hypothetical protein
MINCLLNVVLVPISLIVVRFVVVVQTLFEPWVEIGEP